MKKLMWRLLRKNVSKAQMAGFAIANLIGLTIVIIAVQFYTDVQPLFNEGSGIINNDYMLITRRVEFLNQNSAFSDEEIKDIENQEWARRVGKFTSSNYEIYASIGFGPGRTNIRTDMFFESIPDNFIDVIPDKWGFDPENPEIPVIVSKDYLSLYNFGFASAQGLPQISEDIVSTVPISFTLSGNGQRETINGRIVGFSNRLNTIIVPYDFMCWSNQKFSNEKASDPSRLIIEVKSPGIPEINEYMISHDYEVAGGKDKTSKVSYFLNIIISIVIGVGILISALSFFVLLLSIHLLLQKNSQKLHNLIMLGYSPSEVSKPYIKMVLQINIFIMLGSIALMLLVRIKYLPMLESLSIEPETVLPSITTAIILISAITLGNILAINKKVKSLWIAS